MEGKNSKSLYGRDHLGQLDIVLLFQMTFVSTYEVHSDHRAFEFVDRSRIRWTSHVIANTVYVNAGSNYLRCRV